MMRLGQYLPSAEDGQESAGAETVESGKEGGFEMDKYKWDLYMRESRRL